MLLAADLPQLSWDVVVLRMVVAGVLGAAIGVERELRERQAGLRTHLLVSVGAALFTIAGAYGFSEFPGPVDPTRVAAQIVTGIGFLGAGAIIRQGPAIRGLTTAASLWVVAAIGMAAGAGYYTAAVVTTALVIISLWPLRIVAWGVMRRFRADTARLLVSLSSGTSPAPVIEKLEASGGRIEAMSISHADERRFIEVDVVLPPGTDDTRLVALVADVEDVLEVRWAD